MNGTILNSLSYTYCSADDSVCPTPQRRGLMDDRYKNTTCEFTIQQKRFMESKLEAARNDREEMYENFKVIRLEFSKYKDHAIKKQSGLESENAKLKEELEICRTRLIVSENEKQGLLKSIDCLQQTIKDQNENFQKSNILFE
ncbi:hypothetical protein RF11_10768 [Thelohanellus kitauei]|uniref:Uncharacterized protein n=1 Tax=Thelohanellus kitauei TaxID=669202 RepID=A0A0C2MTM1_THEKT|nr:hypothetical protein RF11_10768 [Thelohanellus kitauei]